MFRTVVTFAAVFVAVVARADTNWVLSQDQVGDWPLTSNWTNGVPTSSVNAYIVNGGTASIGGAGQACYFLSLGGTSTGTVQMGGGSLSAMSEFVGDQGTGTYTQTGGTNTVSATLALGHTIGGTGSYTLSGGQLSSGWAMVGQWGPGIFTQTGGSSTISSLDIGHNAGSQGLYELSGTGYLQGSNEYVGNAGTGTFRQSAGTNRTSWLTIADGATGNGTYELSGTGQLTCTEAEYVGAYGTGTFMQSGGTHTAYQLFVGGENGGTYVGNGTYNLMGSGSLTASYENVGYMGGGTFLQSAGTHTVTSDLYIGYLAYSGSYSLSGSGTLSAPREYIGFQGRGAGTAAFAQAGGTNSATYVEIAANGAYSLSGGTLNLSGGLVNRGVCDLSNSSATINATASIVDLSRAVFSNSAGMSVALDSHSLLIVPADVDPSTYFAHYSNPGLAHRAGSALTIPAAYSISGIADISDHVDCQGGTLAVTSYQYSINLNGGLSVSGAASISLGGGSICVNDSTSVMSGGSVNASSQYIGSAGNGTFTQSGGTISLSNFNSLYMGYNSVDVGSYRLSGTGSLNAIYQHIGESGTATFRQTGGTNTVTDLYLGYNSSGSGSYDLSSTGQVKGAAHEYVGNSGIGTFTQSGGTNSAGYLYLGNNAGSNGTYVLIAGYVGPTGAYVGYSGAGTFTQSGGTHKTGALWLGSNSGGSGTYYLNGGTLALTSLRQGSGTAAFNFGGGTLQANAAFTSSVPMTLTGTGGNSNVDTNGCAMTMSGQLSGQGGLNKLGANSLTLSAANTFTGNTTISGGTLTVTNANALQGSTLDYNNYGGTLSFDSLTTANLGGLKGIQNLSLKNASSAAVAVAVGGNGQSTTYAGQLSGSGSLNKTGTGDLRLTGANGYTGATTVTGGELVVNGSLAQASAVTVQNGGTLGGVGSVGAVTVNLGGHIAPGDAIGATGVFTVAGGLVLNQGTLLNFDLTTPGASDLISMPASTLTLNGQTFSDFAFNPEAGFAPGTYTLIDAGSIQGSLLDSDLSGTIGSYPASLSTKAGDLVLTVTPEPSTIVLLGVSAVGLSGYWRRWSRG